MTVPATLHDAIPPVVSDTARSALFPTPTIDQRVHHLTNQELQRWNGSEWRYDTLSAGVINVRSFGAGPGASSQENATAIQAAIDAADAAVGPRTVFFPDGSYPVDREIEIRANGVLVDLGSAEIIGPAVGTATGGILTVVDRRDTTRLLTRISVRGGLIRPGNVSDNGMNVAGNAHQIMLHGIKVDCTTGQRAFAVQTDNTFTSPAPRIKDVVISDCISFGGGTNGLDIESAFGDNLISDVVVNNMTIRDASTAIRLGGGGNPWFTNRVLLSNITITGAGQAMTADNARRLVIHGLAAHGLTVGGLNIKDAEDSVIQGVYLNATGTPVNGGIAITDTVGVSAGRVNVSDFIIAGGFTNGFIGFGLGTVVGPGYIMGAGTGLRTLSNTQHCHYHDITFDGVSSLVNSFRDADRYTNLMQRSGSDLRVIRNDLFTDVVTTAALPAPGPNMDGRILIEDAGPGDKNVVYYAGGQRFTLVPFGGGQGLLP